MANVTQPECINQTSLLFNTSISSNETLECENNGDVNAPILLTNRSIIETCILLGFIWIVGVSGNGLVILVYWKKIDRFASHLFLLALGFTDFFTCLLIVPQTFFIFVIRRYQRHFEVLSSLLVLVVVTSTLIMVGMSIDRFISIKRPLDFSSTDKRVKVILSIALGLSLLVTLCYTVNVGIGVIIATAVLAISITIVSAIYIYIFFFVWQRAWKGSKVYPATATEMGKKSEKKVATVSDGTLSVNKPGQNVDEGKTTTSGQSHEGMKSNHQGMRSNNVGMKTFSAQEATASGSGPKPDPKPRHLATFLTTITSCENVSFATSHTKARRQILKTIRLLFVIIFVYFISFLPSILSLFGAINLPPQYINTYYISHAANPLIYSFLNKDFRTRVKALLKVGS